MSTSQPTGKPKPTYSTGKPGRAGDMISGTPPRPPKPPTGPKGMMTKKVAKPVAKKATRPTTKDGAK